MFAIKNLSNTDLEILNKELKTKTVNKGDTIIEAGLTGQSMFFLESGTLKYIKRKTVEGKEDEILGIIKPGNFCGEESILSEKVPYRYTVIAQEKSVVHELTKASMQHIMANSMVTGTKILLGISKDYREALNMSTQQARIISFISPKDGSGRTTIAVNLAEMLVKRGKKVIIIDADLQLGDASLFLGSPPNPNITRLVQLEDKLIFERIERFFIQKNSVKLLAGSNLPQEADLVSRAQLSQIIQECSNNCDYLIIDSCCHIDDITLLSWDIADMLFLVTNPDLSSAMRLKRLMRALGRLNYPKEKMHGILNKFKQNDTEFFNVCQNAMPGDWFTVALDLESTEKAINDDNFMSEAAPNGKIVKDLEHIVMHITGEEKDKMQKGGIFSWLGKIFTK
ncbi:MAG: AAA family ATPase [Candidatus Rifleibacteriota bacterium]